MGVPVASSCPRYMPVVSSWFTPISTGTRLNRPVRNAWSTGSGSAAVPLTGRGSPVGAVGGQQRLDGDGPQTGGHVGVVGAPDRRDHVVALRPRHGPGTGRAARDAARRALDDRPLEQ